MAVRPSRITNVYLDERAKIESIQKLRRDAIELRSIVSDGSYGDEELRRFYAIVRAAELTLVISNAELGERVGLGSDFFGSVARDGRSPKLTNFLRALTSVITVANERLVHVDASERKRTFSASTNSRLERDHAHLHSLARSLSLMARDEIARLDAERPNDPESIEKNRKQRELMEIFAEGFDRIAQQLAALSSDPHEPVLLGKAQRLIDEVGNQLGAWWKRNGADAIDWGLRLPVMVGGIAALGWAGADMTVGTTIVAALVGGRKVLDAINADKKDK